MRRVSLPFFVLGIAFLIYSMNINYTGAVIDEGINITNYPTFFFGLVLIFISIMVYEISQSFEARMIPTGGIQLNKKRIRAAMRKYPYESKDRPYVLVSGFLDKDTQDRVKKEPQQNQIYREVREKYKLKPSELIIERKSKDTLGNFLYSLDKLKKKKIYHLIIATSPTQYARFKFFEREARKEGLLPKSFKINHHYTMETLSEFAYGVLAYVKDYIRIKSASSLEEARKQKTGILGKAIKKILHIEESSKKV